MVSDYTAGMGAAAITGTPLALLSLPPGMTQYDTENVHEFRYWDVAGLTDFFNHSGNFIDGVAAVGCVIGWGASVEERISEERKPLLIIGVGAAGVAGSTGINYGYETLIAQNPKQGMPEHGTDMADVAYGSFAGALVSVAFCAAALWQRARLHRRDRRGQTD